MKLREIPLRVSEKQKWIVIGCSCKFFLMGLTWPVLEKAIKAAPEITEQYLACSVYANAFALITMMFVWQSIKKFMIKYYEPIEIIETSAFLLLALYCCIRWDPRVYFLAKIVLQVFGETLLGETATNFKDYLFEKGKERTRIRQEFTLYKGLSLTAAGILGSFIIMSPQAAVMLLVIGDIIRTACCIYTFKYQHPHLTSVICND